MDHDHRDPNEASNLTEQVILVACGFTQIQKTMGQMQDSHTLTEYIQNMQQEIQQLRQEES